MKLLLCYNPYSGKKKNVKIINYVKETLATKYEVDCYLSTGPKSFITYLENLEQKYDIVVACGGDGTVNEVVTGVIRSKFDMTVAIIPLGTVNDMINNLGIKKNYKKAVNAILKGDTKYHDIYKANNAYFSYAFAVGYLSAVSYKSKLKRYFGPVGYYLAGIDEFAKFQTDYLEIEVNGETIKSRFAIMIASNSNSVAGYPLVKHDNLEVVLFKGNRVSTALKLLWFMITKKSKYHYLTDKITMRCKSFDFNTDGEYNPHADTVIITKATKLNFICDRKYLKEK